MARVTAISCHRKVVPTLSSSSHAKRAYSRHQQETGLVLVEHLNTVYANTALIRVHMAIDSDMVRLVTF